MQLAPLIEDILLSGHPWHGLPVLSGALAVTFRARVASRGVCDGNHGVAQWCDEASIQGIIVCASGPCAGRCTPFGGSPADIRIVRSSSLGGGTTSMSRIPS